MACFSARTPERALQDGYVVSLRAFLPLDFDEADCLAFLQGFETTAVDGTEVNKQIATLVALDETVALCFIEPLNGSSLLL